MLTNANYQPSRQERLKWLLDWFVERYGAGVAWGLAARLRAIPALLPTEEQDDLAATAIREYVEAAESANPGARAEFWEAFDLLQPEREWRI